MRTITPGWIFSVFAVTKVKGLVQLGTNGDGLAAIGFITKGWIFTQTAATPDVAFALLHLNGYG